MGKFQGPCVRRGCEISGPSFKVRVKFQGPRLGFGDSRAQLCVPFVGRADSRDKVYKPKFKECIVVVRNVYSLKVCPQFCAETIAVHWMMRSLPSVCHCRQVFL